MAASARPVLAGNQPRPLRIRQILPKPVQRHQQRTANADQKIDVRDDPYPPRGPAAKVQARELDDGRAPTDGREVARVTVAEGPGAPRLRPRADAVRDDAGDISSRLLGCRRD